MPALDRINTTYQRAGLVVLGVSVDEDLRRCAGIRRRHEACPIPILFDTGTEIGRDYYLQKMPMTILVDRSGVVRYSHVGLSSAAMSAFISITSANCCASKR